MCFLCWCSSVLVGKKIKLYEKLEHHVCHNKSMLVITKLLSWQNYVCRYTKVLSQQTYFYLRQNFCHNKHTFVTTKTILEAAPTSDNLEEWNRKKKDTLFTNEEQTKVGSWCIWYFATHFGLVYDVDYAECWAQNGSNQNTRNWKNCHLPLLFCWVRPCYTYRVHTEKSFENSQTFQKPLQYGAEKQHEGTQLFHTSGKRVQPLLQPMALHSTSQNW